MKKEKKVVHERRSYLLPLLYHTRSSHAAPLLAAHAFSGGDQRTYRRSLLFQ
jgi:hypothetical protein